MQVLHPAPNLAGELVSAWHRRTPDTTRLACNGEWLDRRSIYPTRREQLRSGDGAPLCNVCHTPLELAIAAHADADAAATEIEARRKWHEEAEARIRANDERTQKGTP